MQYVDRTFGKFDKTKPLVALRQMTLLGHEVAGGDPISELKDGNGVPLDSGILCRLWMTRWADYAEDVRPTPELAAPTDPDDTTGVAYSHTGGGWYSVTAPWLDDPIKVQGAAAAEAKAEELRAAHAALLQPLDDLLASVLVAEEDETFTVTAPWLENPELFATAELAEARQAQLREEGPPEGWGPSTSSPSGE